MINDASDLVQWVIIGMPLGWHVVTIHQMQVSVDFIKAAPDHDLGNERTSKGYICTPVVINLRNFFDAHDNEYSQQCIKLSISKWYPWNSMIAMSINLLVCVSME